MNLDMWFRDDIANLLSAALQAGQFMQGEGGDFQRGYAAAVAVMATNFHLTAADLRPAATLADRQRQATGTGNGTVQKRPGPRSDNNEYEGWRP